MDLDVEVGVHSERGLRPVNEDCAAAAAARRPTGSPYLIAALADGVAGHDGAPGGGAAAARSSIAALLADFDSTPDTWETSVALDRVLNAQNAWLVAQNRRWSGTPAAGAGMCTMTAVVLDGHGYTLAHIGDTRAWLLRAGTLSLLTQDHVVDHPDLRSQLTRALGMDEPARLDTLEGEMQAGDIFLLASDGVHGVLGPRRLAELAVNGTAQESAGAIVREALRAGSRDNATAMVLRVRGIGEGGLEDATRRARQLPVPGALRVGQHLDHFQVTALVSDNGVNCLVQARDLRDQQLVALKTLHPARAHDEHERQMLGHEAWLAARVTQGGWPGFVRLREVPEATALYLAFDWHNGRTLAQIIEAQRRGQRAPMPVSEAIAAGLALGRALGRLHRLGIVHRDINPRNLHRGDDGQWRILDLGVALSGREPAALRALHAGTPSYMNPEQWQRDDPPAEGPAPRAADARGDLFALGVTLYECLTGTLPYGDVEPWQIARYRRDPPAPSRRRPDIPIWLDHVILKAVARDGRERFETAEEWVLALERGAARPLPAQGATPLSVRDPLTLWKIAFAVAMLFNVLLIFWLFFLPR